jgi:Tol biopolymer transport system component
MKRMARAYVALFITAVAALLACSNHPRTGDLIVYEASDGSATNIYTINSAGNDRHQLTFGTSFDGNPAWSSDRKRVVFTSDRGGAKNDLYVIDRGGGDARRLTDTPDASEFSPKFSSDGSKIAYVREAGDGWTIWLMDAEATSQRQVAGPYKFAEFPAWSPDSSELYYSAIEAPSNHAGGSATAHIYSVDVQTRDVQTRIQTAGADSCPHFSHDGSRLTYASSSDGDEESLTIFSHDPASDDTTGASDIALTQGAARDDYPNPSPDDSKLVFISDRDGNAELYLMDRSGENQRRLSNTPHLRENVPDW